jgi:hypothetical protein
MYSLRKRRISVNELLSSKLYDQNTFYNAFIYDLRNCTKELIIESPFITAKRMSELLPIFRKLAKRGVKIVINTRDPLEHEGKYQIQAQDVVENLQKLGATVLFTGGHHRKLAIIDRLTTWEGSLNILSHNDSCEIMRRTQSVALAKQLMQFIKIEKYLMG